MVNKETVKIIGRTGVFVILVSLVIRGIPDGWLIGVRENFLLFSFFCFMITVFEVVLTRVVQPSSRSCLLAMLGISLFGMIYFQDKLVVKAYLASFIIQQLFSSVIYCCKKNRKWYIWVGAHLLLLFLYSAMSGGEVFRPDGNWSAFGGVMVPIFACVTYWIGISDFANKLPSAFRLEEE